MGQHFTLGAGPAEIMSPPMTMETITYAITRSEFLHYVYRNSERFLPPLHSNIIYTRTHRSNVAVRRVVLAGI